MSTIFFTHQNLTISPNILYITQESSWTDINTASVIISKDSQITHQWLNIKNSSSLLRSILQKFGPKSPDLATLLTSSLTLPKELVNIILDYGRDYITVTTFRNTLSVIEHHLTYPFDKEHLDITLPNTPLCAGDKLAVGIRATCQVQLSSFGYALTLG